MVREINNEKQKSEKNRIKRISEELIGIYGMWICRGYLIQREQNGVPEKKQALEQGKHL